MLREPGTGLFLEPGSGKTVLCLTAMLELLRRRRRRILVVAPKLVAQEVWAREAAKWKHTAHLAIDYLDVSIFNLYRKVTWSAVLGDEARTIVEHLMTDDDARFLFMCEVAVPKYELLPRDWRATKERVLRSTAEISVISRDHLFMLAKLLGKDWPFEVVIGDESTSWKNVESDRSKAMLYLRKTGLVENLTLLSGTPSPKSVLNLFAQVRLLDLGKRLGYEIGEFRNTYMVPAFQEKVGGRLITRTWSNAPGAEEAVTAKIKDICLAVRADAWRATEAPKTIYRYVTLPEAVRTQYVTMLEDWKLVVSGSDVTARQAATLSNKLIQIATGAVFDDERNYHILHDAKLEMLDELIEELEGEPLVVVYWFNPTLDRLKKRYGNKLATVKTRGFLDRFARGELPLLALQPGNAGHGLDGLQKGGHHIAFVDVFHDWELAQQVVSRLDRSGQKHQVKVHMLLADRTAEEGVAAELMRKAGSQARVMNALKIV